MFGVVLSALVSLPHPVAKHSVCHLINNKHSDFICSPVKSRIQNSAPHIQGLK